MCSPGAGFFILFCQIPVPSPSCLESILQDNVFLCFPKYFKQTHDCISGMPNQMCAQKCKKGPQMLKRADKMKFDVVDGKSSL